MKNKLYLGWDIGGANTKICVFDSNFTIIDVHVKNIKVWNNFDDLKSFFKFISNLYENFEINNFITITAESCDNFADRESGISEILSNCNYYINGNKLYYTNSNTYIDYDNALMSLNSLFSTNWMLTSNFLNSKDNIDLIVDIGSTTTDIIFKDMDIKNNINDHMRLTNNTLLYIGVVRTPLAMMANNINFKGDEISLVNEVFATTGDIFNIINDINFVELDYLGSDNLKFEKFNSFVRLSRILGFDYKTSHEKDLIDVSYDFKKLFISKIVDNIKKIFGNKFNDLTISSVGEGRFLIKEMCALYNIKYWPIENICLNFTETLDRNKIYSNMTSALVVINFNNIKNYA
tara:strand:+ start:1655 stop:2698 length:1044 start_codon:yes stop_codon:yes gene_type:complete